MTTVLDSASRAPGSLRGASASASTYGPLARDLDVDVCVVGGGLAGITIARELARRGWSVAVLEAKRIAWNASSRNAGVVRPGFAEDIDTIVDRVGLAHAKQLWALSAKGVDYVRSTLSELKVAGIDPGDGFLEVSLSDNAEKQLHRAARLQGEFGAAVDYWPTDKVRAVLRTGRYFQALRWQQAFQLPPLAYALGLASTAHQAGARIFEETAAIALDVSGVRKRVETPAGRVRAHHVVLAGGAHLGALFAANSGTVMPIVSYLAATAPIGERLRQAIRYSGGVGEMQLGGDHYRTLPDGRLMWGGGISARTSPPQALGARIAKRIRDTYPQLGAVDVTSTVSGVMGYAVHRMPQIGEIAPGVWLASAFGAQGLNTTAMAGVLIARAILEGDDRWRWFAPYELVWAGGALGQATAQCLFWAMEGRRRVQLAVSRYRDARRRAASRNLMMPDLSRERPISIGTAADPGAEPPGPPAETGHRMEAARLPDEAPPSVAAGARVPPRRGAPRSGTRCTTRPVAHRTQDR